MEHVEAVGLRKSFGKIEAVKGVSFKVRGGELYALLGPNGAGKTTTIKMLSTLLKPTAGDALILGHSVLKEPHVVRGLIGLVPQELTADDELTGFYNVYIQARLYGYKEDEARRRAEEALRAVGLWESAERRVSTYSGGMRRRLEIAMSLVNDPQVLFLDEPTLGLDVQTRRVIWELIRGFKREGKAMILTTHYMEEAESLADRVGIIDMGEIKAEGTPDELKGKLKGDKLYVELYGDSDIDPLAAEIRKLGFDVRVEGTTLIIPVMRGDTITSILSSLSKARVRSINIVRPNLEEVFIEITGRRLREESFDAFKHRAFMMRARG